MNHLPLTLPLRYLGMSDAEVDQIDSVLQPQIDAAYARNDNWFTRPVSVDPVRGLDPLTAPGSIVEGARGLLGSPPSAAKHYRFDPSAAAKYRLRAR